MPHSDFDAAYWHFIGGFLRPEDPHYATFGKWVTNKRVRAHIQLRPENRHRPDPPRDSHGRRRPISFRPSLRQREEIEDLRDMLGEVACMKEDGKRVPANFETHILELSSYSTMQGRLVEWNAWKKQLAQQSDYQELAQLPDGHRIMRVLTFKGAVREGGMLHNCLRTLEYSSTHRPYQMASIVDDLQNGGIWSLWDKNDSPQAYLHFHGPELRYVRGQLNGGLKHEHAMLLRDFVQNAGFVTGYNAAPYLGLIEREHGSYLPYEQELPGLLADDNIDLMGLPVRDGDLAPLKHRTIHTLQLIHCVNLTTLPEGLQAGKGVRLFPFDRQPHLMPVEEARDYLEGTSPQRPGKKKRRSATPAGPAA